MRVGYRKGPESSGMEGYVVGATCEGIYGRCVVGHEDGDGDGNRGMEGMADGIITKSGDEGCSGMMSTYSSCCETALPLGVERAIQLAVVE